MNIEKDFEYWVDSLIEEGYDLSDYTWDEIYEEYLSEMGRRMTTGQYQAPQPPRIPYPSYGRRRPGSSPAPRRGSGSPGGSGSSPAPRSGSGSPGGSGSSPAPRRGEGYRSSSDGRTYRNYNDALYARNTRLLRPLESTPNTASGFDTTFAKARELGVKKFKWRGGEYTTKLANEDFEYWVDSLFEEGYDLSNYTWEGLFEYFCENVLSEVASQPRKPDPAPTAAPTAPTAPAPTAPTGAAPGAAKGPAAPKSPSPTILASKNGIPGTMTKGDPSSWKAKEGGYSSSELQRIRSVGNKRYEDQRKAAVSSGKGFESTTKTGREVWSMSNPKLAAAADEKERIWRTSQTDNPLMKDLRSRLPLTPRIQSPTLGARLGPSSGNQSLVQNSNVALGASPNKNSSVGSSASSTKEPPPTPKKTTSPERPKLPQRPIAGKEELIQRSIQSSFDFSSPSKVASDMAYLYQSIYEGKKKVDQDVDGDNDFADVMIARMVAAGVPRAEAIRRVRNKDYNV